MRINGLTPQQYRVACLIAEGKTDKQIASILGLHDEGAGVRFHVRQIAKAWGITASNVRVMIANRLQKPAA